MLSLRDPLRVPDPHAQGMSVETWVGAWPIQPAGPVACWAASKLARPCGSATCGPDARDVASRGADALVHSRRLVRRLVCAGAGAQAPVRYCMSAPLRGGEQEASRGFEPRSLDSESRVLTVTPRGHAQSLLPCMHMVCLGAMTSALARAPTTWHPTER